MNAVLVSDDLGHLIAAAILANAAMQALVPTMRVSPESRRNLDDLVMDLFQTYRRRLDESTLCPSSSPPEGDSMP